MIRLATTALVVCTGESFPRATGKAFGVHGSDFQGLGDGAGRHFAFQCTCATASVAGGAAEAVVGGKNGLGGYAFGGDVPEEERLTFGALLHAQHLVEVAVEDLSLVADVDRAAAHQANHGGGVEAIGEQLHVIIPLPVLPEIHGEAGDGQIGDGEKPGEDDAVALLQFDFVIGFKFGLVGRELCTDGVVNEGQWQRGAVANGVELLQGTDAFLKDAIAALGIDIVLQIARKRSNNLHFVFRQVFRQVGVGFGLDNREVVAVDDVRTHRTGSFHKVVEKLADLRSTAGDVHDLGPVLADPRPDFVRDFLGHHFGAVRAGIDVAVSACLVALAADVDLQGLKASAGERSAVGMEFLLERIHFACEKGGLEMLYEVSR